MARSLAVGIAAALLLVLPAAPASALNRSVSWASPGGPLAGGTGVEFPGFVGAGDVCGARRTVINMNLQSIAMASTPDGSKVFFTTPDKLLAADTDTLDRDIYEFSGGQLRLVTPTGGGFDTTKSIFMLGCSADGSRVFFTSEVQDLWQGSSAGVPVRVNVPEPPCCAINFAPARVAFSEDGTTVAFDTETPLTSDDGDTNKFDVFERSGGDTKLVSELTGSEAAGSTLGGISADGSRIYFTSADQLAANDPTSAQDLYVRVNDADPVVVSEDPATEMAAGGNSFFAGATEDGTHVYFATAAGIDADDDDSDGDIYDRNATAGTTTWLNEPAVGSATDAFPDLMAFSQDAARVFFASTAALTADDTDSTNDLYLRTSSGLKLVTKQVAGAAQNLFQGCHEAYSVRSCASTDATRIFFNTPERLLAADTDATSDIYRFTAPNGPLQLITPAGTQDNEVGAVSENGARAIFTTRNRLLPSVDNDVSDDDVYEWDNGTLNLVSRPLGATQQVNRLGTTSADASTVFFTSTARYAGSDNDGAMIDLFAARPCTPATCPPPAAAQPVVKPVSKDVVAPKATLSGAKTQKAGSSVSVTVRCDEACVVNASGTVSVPGAAKVFKLGKARRSIRAGGKAKLKLKVSKKARRAIRKALRRKRKVRATIKLRIADSAGNTRRPSRKIRLKR